VPVRNGSNPEAPDGGHSTQEGTVDDAAGDVADGDAVPLVVAAGVEVDDDPPAAVGAVNVTGAGVAAEGVVAATAGRPTAPAAVEVPAGGVAPIVERLTAPEPVVAVCAAAGPTSAIRSGSVKRNGWAILVSDPCLTHCYERHPASISPLDVRGQGAGASPGKLSRPQALPALGGAAQTAAVQQRLCVRRAAR
jgi:hypothetical protein